MKLIDMTTQKGVIYQSQLERKSNSINTKEFGRYRFQE